jgi:hypothetical protein
MNDDAVTLDLRELDGTGIRLRYGLTASLAKDGANKLMLVLADVFKKEREARTGKIPSDTQIDVRIDFEEFNPEELRRAFEHLVSLASAFHPPSFKVANFPNKFLWPLFFLRRYL